MKHLSIDLETLGIGDNAAIVQIGAILFDPWEGDGTYTLPGLEFNVHIDLGDPNIGVLDAPCVGWWMKQSDDARRRVFNPDLSCDDLSTALLLFGKWICDHAEFDRLHDLKAVWSHTSFDFRLIQQACKRLDLGLMFDRRADRDLRTLTAMGRSLGIKAPPFIGVQHDAADDAFHQAVHATAIIRKLGVFKSDA